MSISTVVSRTIRATSALTGAIATLLAHPGSRVVVPLVGLGQYAHGRGKVIPPPLLGECGLHSRHDECAALPRADPAVELGHDIVVECQVQSHGPTLAH